MNSQRLIDAVIRQTTVLVAHLATSAGLRAPLAHIANAVFLDLAAELEQQGVSRKVAADMFGLALRSYQSKVQRLAARDADDHESLWQSVYDEIRCAEVVARGELLRTFYDQDEQMLSAVLRDLVETGLIFEAGRGDARVYRPAKEEELASLAARDDERSAVPLVWIHVYRMGPIGAAELAEQTGLSAARVEAALEILEAEGRISGEGRPARYHTQVCVIPADEPAGWEAAFFDHFNAVVTAFVVKLREMSAPSLPADEIGGSTYSFRIWEGHPHEAQVRGLLRRTRERISALRREVDTYNHGEGAAIDAREGESRVTFYFGQSILEAENGE